MFFLTTVCPTICFGQNVELKLYLGALYYQGDLAPSSSNLSFSPGRASWGLGIGTKLNDAFRIHGKFYLGQIGASDSESRDESRKLRNLSFASSIVEFGVTTDFSLNSIWKGLDKYGIELYYTTGIQIFRFNPQAVYGGTLIDLQPLGTEGQGLAGFENKYALTQVNVPFGLGFRFPISNRIEFGVELTPRFTFTDFLDDVSGDYVGRDELIAAGRPVAAILSNRTGEFLGDVDYMVPTGTGRGDPTANDWYFFAGVTIAYHWGADVDLKVKKVNIKNGENNDSETEKD